MLNAKAVLKEYFGHSEFRNGQEQVVDSILQGRDALCVMPTGAGKSVCYQVPSLLLEGMTLVISPLISLMKDQVNALIQNGIRAAYLNSSLTAAQYAQVLENIRRGMYKIVYVSPERLTVPAFLSVCQEMEIDLIAVDEAHCVSQWGQDFRPSYLKIASFVDALGYRPVIAAFTATATATVKEDVERALRLKNPFRITTGFDRPNLKFEVVRPQKKLDALLKILRRHGRDSGIIYCSTRHAVESLGEELASRGFSVGIYHGGLEDAIRKKTQEDFVYDRIRIMVATNAFGMGIDKSDVSYVIHYNMPANVESYYQEAGRAGRDGADAECILLYAPSDVHTNEYLIEHKEPNPELAPEQQETLRERDYARLKKMTVYSTTNTCLRSYILEYFGEAAVGYCGNCSNCLTQFEEVDVTEDAKKVISCIRETGQRFGRTMIGDILRGSKNEKLLRMRLDGCASYATMTGVKPLQMKELLDGLLLAGYVVSTGGEYPVLAVTGQGEAFLHGEERMRLKRAKDKKEDAKKKKSRTTGEADVGLFEELRALRREIAEERHLPAYMIFSDAALIDMCRRLPASEAEMLEVSGVGRVKCALYGERFLSLIRRHPSHGKNE